MTWYSSGAQSICMAKREIDSMPTFDPHDANMAANMAAKTGRRMEQACSRAARFNSEQRRPRKAERARGALWSMTLSLAQNWPCRAARVARRLLLDTPPSLQHPDATTRPALRSPNALPQIVRGQSCGRPDSNLEKATPTASICPLPAPPKILRERHALIQILHAEPRFPEILALTWLIFSNN
jgi:hypothetical protein